ncbi:uncharacterized protein LOC142738540 [Rhinoderma darwinii]|uniref:uncharacterized protein LOC142738540 n=1 Tax=Rhinoderma darwinii TaxID=43563 RepID=UPI003F66CE9F
MLHPVGRARRTHRQQATEDPVHSAAASFAAQAIYELEMDVDHQPPSTTATRSQKLDWLKLQLQSKYGSMDDSGVCFPKNPLREMRTEDIDECDGSERISNSNWCLCNNCIAMPTNIESICCKEIPNVEPFMDNITCITEHDYFQQFCGDRERVHISMRAIGEIRLPPPDKDLNRLLRKTAYRGFTSWIHGYLGKGNRRPIPSCAVKIIRDVFCDPVDEYCGFLFFTEEPAEYLAMDYCFEIF